MFRISSPWWCTCWVASVLHLHLISCYDHRLSSPQSFLFCYHPSYWKAFSMNVNLIPNYLFFYLQRCIRWVRRAANKPWRRSVLTFVRLLLIVVATMLCLSSDRTVHMLIPRLGYTRCEFWVIWWVCVQRAAWGLGARLLLNLAANLFVCSTKVYCFGQRLLDSLFIVQ